MNDTSFSNGYIKKIQQRIIQNANVWMMILDAGGRVIEWNAAAEEISGYSSEELKGGSDIWKRLYPDRVYRREVSRQINEIISSSSYLENFSTTITTKNGEKKYILWNTRELPHPKDASPVYIGVGVDITDQKKAEERIRLQAVRTQKLLELDQMKDSAFSEMLAFSLEACLKMTESRYSFIGLMNSDESVMSIRSWSQDVMEECRITDRGLDFPVASTGVLGESVRRRAPFELNDYSAPHPAKHGCPTGHVHITRFLAVPLFDGDHIVAVIAVANKETDYNEGDTDALTTLGNHLWELLHRREAEEALKKSEERYRAFFSTSRDCVFITSVEGQFIDFNDEMVTILGYESRKDLMQARVADVYADPDERDRHTAFIHEHGYSKEYPVTLKRKDGTTIDALITTVVVRDAQGNVTHFQGTIRDVTEQRRAEEELRDSEKLLTDVGRLAKVGGVKLDIESQEARFTLEASRIFDLSDRDTLKVPEVLLLFDERDRSMVKTAMQRCIGTGDPFNFELPIKTTTGRHNWVRIMGHKVSEEGGVGKLIGAIQDITELKEAEAALEESEEKFRGVAERSSELIFLSDDTGKGTYVSPSIERILGYRPEDIIGKTAYSFIVKEDHEAISEVIKKNRTGISVDNLETRIRKKDGGISFMELSLSPIVKDGIFSGVQVIGRDITERKAARERIAELLRIVNTSPAVAFLLRAEKNWPVEMMSENITQFGYTPEDFLSGRIMYSDIIHPDDAGQVSEVVEYNSRNGIDEYIQVYRIFGGEGDEYWIEDYTHIRRNYKGRITHYEGVILDITERKRSEEALEKNRRQLEEAMDMAQQAHWEFDIASGLFTFNDRFYALYGTSAEREGGYEMPAEEYAREFVHPDDGHMVADEVRAAQETTDPNFSSQLEHRIIRRDGEIRYIVVRIGVILDKEGRPVKTHGVNQDITERKRMEMALRESRQLFSDIISFLPDPTFVIDNQGKVLAWNRAIENMSGIQAEDIIGKGNYEYSVWMYGERRPILIDLVIRPDMDFARMKYEDIHRDESTITAETGIVRPDGTEMTLSLVASPLFGPEGETAGAIESIRDITRMKETEEELAQLNENLEQMVSDRTQELEEEVAARKKAEQVIRASLDEKVVLLREIHHRVKNNLQIIISLMNLQIRKASDPNVKVLLQETQDRVRAMSLVHEKLYGSEDLARIDLSAYLNSLIRQLFATHGEAAQKVTLHMEFDRIMTEINVAIPLGLVMNELISNAMKHAFPGDVKGNVTIRGRTAGGEIRISYEDDGVGFPPGFSLHEVHTLGLHLVTSLVRQLDSTIEKTDTTKGVSFSIVIPCGEKGVNP
jgi:PAS domain S-box-containing protein